MSSPPRGPATAAARAHQQPFTYVWIHAGGRDRPDAAKLLADLRDRYPHEAGSWLITGRSPASWVPSNRRLAHALVALATNRETHKHLHLTLPPLPHPDTSNSTRPGNLEHHPTTPFLHGTLSTNRSNHQLAWLPAGPARDYFNAWCPKVTVEEAWTTAPGHAALLAALARYRPNRGAGRLGIRNLDHLRRLAPAAFAAPDNVQEALAHLVNTHDDIAIRDLDPLAHALQDA